MSLINHLPPACWSTFWKSIFKQQLGCRFDIMDSISSFFCILTYAVIYVLKHHIIFWRHLYFLNILFFPKYSCTNIFHRRSLCTFCYVSHENNTMTKTLQYNSYHIPMPWHMRYHLKCRKGQNKYQGIKLSSLLEVVCVHAAYKCGTLPHPPPPPPPPDSKAHEVNIGPI